ncbi:MAG: hypothetical protein CMJ25_18995 [Phycisphaerae bacterium]|nr:hypothetical protein [Phycisphaerae bacterium]|tara:strand:- start:624 stop:1679 length:1056 start_codon:yes stop_codon:yes gene_type:complete
MMGEQQQAVDIGDISELNGSAQIVRDKPLLAKVNLGIQSNDEAITRNGRMAITFLDDSTVRLTENSELLIDEYIYDPDPSKSKMALTFGLGTARFITGNLNRIDKQNIQLKTPTANIAIRGTDFTATVDELGRSLIILLPDAYGVSSGEIEVITATGSVLLNKPYQATTVSVFESSPSKPVILDLTLDIIDNMLIVTPPEEETVETERVIVRKKNVLDFDDLDIDYLEEDFLKDDELEFTELDINYLDVNFLEDLLDVIDALEVAKEEDVLGQDAISTNIKGTKFGQDLSTQITTFYTGDKLSLIRSVQNTARVDINSDASYTVIFIQNGVSKVVTINGGEGSTIKITQDN